MVQYTSREELCAVLDRMVANLQANAALQSRLGPGETSVGFTISDLAVEYALRFAPSGITGGQGGAATCRIGVTLTSKVLDDLFSGRADPESAYSYGSLYLRGDEWEAQSLLRYWGDITSAYRAATT